LVVFSQALQFFTRKMGLDLAVLWNSGSTYPHRCLQFLVHCCTCPENTSL